MRGGRSLPQSKYGLTTTDFGMNGAESVVVAPVRLAEARSRRQRRVPVDLAVDRLGVRVEQQLVRVAALPAARVVRAVHAVAVALARARRRAGSACQTNASTSGSSIARLARRRRRTGTARPARRPRRTARSWCPSRRRSRRAGTRWPGHTCIRLLRSDLAVPPGTSNLTHHAPYARRRWSRLPRVSGPLLAPPRPAVSARWVVLVAFALIVGFVLARLAAGHLDRRVRRGQRPASWTRR